MLKIGFSTSLLMGKYEKYVLENQREHCKGTTMSIELGTES